MSAEEALEYIKSRPEGALQSDLWKALKIDSRKCSRIVAKLLKDNLITREVESVDGIRTYRLFCAPKPKERRFYPLLRWIHSSPALAASTSAYPSTAPSSPNGSSPL